MSVVGLIGTAVLNMFTWYIYIFIIIMIDDIPIELEEEIRIQVVPSILTHTSIVSNV